jgi:hypothetical protein
MANNINISLSEKDIVINLSNILLSELRENTLETAETNFKHTIAKIITSSYKNALEQRDKELLKNKERSLITKDSKSRTIITTYGEVKFKRRRYFDSKKGRTTFLLDQDIKLSANKSVTDQTIQAFTTGAINSSYEATSKQIELITGCKIGKTTIRNMVGYAAEKIENLDSNKPYDDKIQTNQLFVEADGVWIPKQNKHSIGKKFIESSVGKVYTKKKGDRCENLQTVVSVGRNKFWNKVNSTMSTKYDLSNLDKVYLGSDGEKFYKTGFQDASFEVIHKLDPWHLKHNLRYYLPKKLRKEINFLIFKKHDAKTALYVVKNIQCKTQSIEV